MVRQRLHRAPPVSFDFKANGDLSWISAVLFLLEIDSDGDPWLILNKRSPHVRQPGDLCCPGGGVAPRIDGLLARGIDLPAMPLYRWPHRQWWRRRRPMDFSKLALLTATALREGFEEMRLSPLNVSLLGPLHPEHLVMFKRSIYPLVASIDCHQRFILNWEVDAIVRIPLRTLFDTGNYACCRFSLSAAASGAVDNPIRDMPCFVHRQNGSTEMLWGATYRIVEQFLKTAFDFDPPPLEVLPVIHRRLKRHYITGTTDG
jgi:8-oxo-dGTP pyrophosphatase MutT (NUDIX family)